MNEHGYLAVEKTGKAVLPGLETIDVIDLLGEVSPVVKTRIGRKMLKPGRELRSFVHVQLVVVVLAMESAT